MAALVAWSPLAAAERIVLTRARAIELGASRGPTAVEARAGVSAAQALHETAQAPLAYAPRLGLVGGARRGDFGTGAELGASIVQDLSLHGLGGARRELADAYGRAAHGEADRGRLDGAGVAALAWVELVEAQELVAHRERATTEARELARVAQARVDRGVALPLEALLARTEVGNAELAERDGEGRLATARADMRLAIGAAPTDDVSAEGALEAPDSPNERQADAEHPAVAAARARTVLATAEVDVAKAQASAPIGVGVSVLREGTGQQIATGVLSIPLPFLDPGRFEGARQQANVAVAQAHERRVRDELARDVAVAEHERVHTREVRDALRERVLVPLRDAVRVARAAYESGAQDATTFILLRQRLVAAEEQLGHANAEVVRADLRWEIARGAVLEEVRR